jgi:hypothetical protein
VLAGVIGESVDRRADRQTGSFGGRQRVDERRAARSERLGDRGERIRAALTTVGSIENTLERVTDDGMDDGS